jgi:excisionase family DNA binding protein
VWIFTKIHGSPIHFMLTQLLFEQIVVSRTRTPRDRNRRTINNPLLLTIDEAGQALGLSRSSVRRLINAGDLPSVKVGGCRRISAQAIANYVSTLTEAAS